MVGRQSSDNKLGLTQYVVGKVTGDGCLYGGATGIQDAIDDAFAAGGGVVAIRPDNTPYVENLTLRAGVDVIGFSVDGRLPNPLGKVSITGVHTFNATTPFSVVIMRDLSMDSGGGGDLITVTATGGNNCIIACKETSLTAMSAGERAVVLNADAGSAAQFSTDGIQLGSDSHCFDMLGTGNQSASMQFGSANSTNGNVYNMTGANCFGGAMQTQISGSYIAFMSSTGGQSFSCSYSDLFCQNEAVNFVTNGNADVKHSTISSSAGSGFWITGTGSLTFVDVGLSIANGIDPLVTQTKENWQPYGEASPTSSGSIRGTSSYDSAQFSVTDGWVQFTGSVNTTWIDQAASTTVNANQGNFAVIGDRKSVV